MTPLYDVVSAQPNVDAGQIRYNRFRMALSVGDNRHDAVNTVASRHFVQTARRAGVGEEVVASIFDELQASAAKAIEHTLGTLPEGFPSGIAASIQSGMVKRLRALELRK
jgi:serine/threonine-protein kinase HipA